MEKSFADFKYSFHYLLLHKVVLTKNIQSIPVVFIIIVYDCPINQSKK